LISAGQPLRADVRMQAIREDEVTPFSLTPEPYSRAARILS